MLPKLENFDFRSGYTYLYFAQRLTIFKNYYDIFEVINGELTAKRVGYAEQKAFKLKEEITFWKDEMKQSVQFTMQARNIMDIASKIDVSDHQKNKVGYFQKNFGSSLLRSEWQVGSVGDEKRIVLLAQERSWVGAIARRIMGVAGILDFLVPFIRINFDFRNAEGELVGQFTRGFGLKDTYLMEIRTDILETIGIETISSLGVALDTLQDR